MESPDKLRRSIGRALRFMEGTRNPDGLWSDFLTLAGESVFWVSGYVGYAVTQSLLAAKGEDWLKNVGSKIAQRQSPAGGWGYGPGVPEDADSTAWCMLFLSGLGVQRPESREKAKRFLLGHQSRLDGGFRTYAKPAEVGQYMMLDDNVSFDGWSSSQTCVTGVVVQALLKARSNEGVEEALEFIRTSQRPDGFWLSYWWTERLYATVQCMEALDALRRGDDDYSKRLRRAQEWIAGTQLSDGAWSESPASGGFPFSTALAVKGLLLGDSPGRHIEKITRGTEWLLARQLADGSWAPQHMLRIPHPSVKEPWRQTSWKEDGRAIGAIIRDHRRLYTTATALRAISEYDRMMLSSNG